MPGAAHPSLTLRDGCRMPAIGFGTWRCDATKLHDAVLHALRVGFRHLDCASLYKNEHIVGAALRAAIAEGIVTRPEVFLTGKRPMACMDATDVEGNVRKTLHDLGVDHLDLLLTHWPYAVDPSNTASPPTFAARRGYSPAAYLTTWRAMEACVDAGLVRSLGCSNMTAKKLAALCAPGAARIPPVNVQVELHPALAQPSLLAFAAAHGIVVTGYSPLSSPGRPDAYRSTGDPDVLSHPTTLAIATRIGRSPAQVCLRWAVQRGTVPLPRSTTLSRIEENADVFSWALEAADMDAMDAQDATAGSVGRIMKGDHSTAEGQDWRDLWDEDFVVDVARKN